MSGGPLWRHPALGARRAWVPLPDVGVVPFNVFLLPHFGPRLVLVFCQQGPQLLVHAGHHPTISRGPLRSSWIWNYTKIIFVRFKRGLWLWKRLSFLSHVCDIIQTPSLLVILVVGVESSHTVQYFLIGKIVELNHLMESVTAWGLKLSQELRIYLYIICWLKVSYSIFWEKQLIYSHWHQDGLINLIHSWISIPKNPSRLWSRSRLCFFQYHLDSVLNTPDW